MSKTTRALQSLTPQIVHYWAHLAPWQRRMLLSAIGLLAIVLAWALAPRPTRYSVLFADEVFDQRELMRVETAFHKANLRDYKLESGRLSVPVQHRSEYLAALEDASALPEKLGDRTLRELGRVNPFESADQRRKRLQDAHRREVADIISSLEGIDEAFVQFSQTSSSPFAREQHVEATVAIRLSPHSAANPQLIHSVRKLVSSGHAGLDPEGVTIIDLNSGRSFSQPDSVLAATDEYLSVKQTFERLFVTKLQRQLAYVPGLRVMANVELRRVKRTDGRSGVREHWAPSVVSASLAIPASYLAHRFQAVQGSDEKVDAIRQGAIEEVRRAALAVLPPPASGHAADLISIAVFNDQAADAVGTNPRKKRLSTTMAVGMGIALMLMAWVVVWGRPKRPRVHVEGPSEGRATATSDHPTPITEPSLRVHERLTELVRENPKAAADTISQWVRKAG